MAVKLILEEAEVPASTGGTRAKWVEHLRGLMDTPFVAHKVADFDDAKECGPRAGYLRGTIPKRLGGKWEFYARGTELYALYVGPANGKAKKKK